MFHFRGVRIPEDIAGEIFGPRIPVCLIDEVVIRENEDPAPGIDPQGWRSTLVDQVLQNINYLMGSTLFNEALI